MASVRLDGPTRDLRRAARNGDVAAVASALDRGADVNVKDGQGAPPLLDAAQAGYAEVVHLLLARGADPNLPLWGEAGNTILTWTVRSGQQECAIFLVEAGARVTPWTFKMAAEGSLPAVVRAAVSSGADVNGVTWDGTALMASAYYGRMAMVRLLLELGADPNAGTPNGWRPLMSAAAMGHAEVVGLLLAAGADASAQSKDGDTALKLAEEAGRTKIVQMLREADAGA